jgi:peptidoglycan/xylan/chitin deacetylase (PgdA/CDA1 family)
VNSALVYRAVKKIFVGSRRLKHRVHNLFDPPVVVLIYHRVTNLKADPQLLAVSPENFQAQMRFLKDSYPLVRFEDDWSRIERPSIAVTFDDGYADNALTALPILEEVGVPATFFVSTGNLGTMREYWWDELERLIVADHSLPENFTLRDSRFGRTWATATPAQCEAFYQQLHPLMKKLASSRREDWLLQLRQWAGADETGRAANRAMSCDEIRRLAGSKWVTIGAHTVTHTPLSILSEGDQRHEITSSKQDLENIIGREISTFSYPFGGKKDYNRTSVHLCREAGFVKAAANYPGQAHRWTDPYQLPRQLVRNWDPATFTDRIKDFWA